MKKTYDRIVAALLATCVIVRAEPPAEVRSVSERFTATKEGVELTYQISYHVLGLQLMDIGQALSFSVEGLWRADDGTTVPAYYSEVRLNTHDRPGESDPGRICIHNRIATVMTSPEFKTLVYFKETNEYLNPFFKGPRHDHYLDYYAVTGGGIDYFREDHGTGTRTTALENAGELLQQANAIAETIQRMADIYRGRADALTSKSDFRAYFNVEGTVKPFAAESSMESIKGGFAEHAQKCLRVDLSLAPEAEGRAGALSLWGVPFAELAETTARPDLLRLTEEAPAWSMIPLRMVYTRPVGHIRCRLDSIRGKSF